MLRSDMILYFTIGVLIYAASITIDPDPTLKLKHSISIVLLWPAFLLLIIYYSIHK